MDNVHTVYIVEASYSDYEWSRNDLIGVFTTLAEAKLAKEKYVDKITKLKSKPNPLTDDEQGMDITTVNDSSYELYSKWQSMQSEIYYYNDVGIRTVKLNKGNFKMPQ